MTTLTLLDIPFAASDIDVNDIVPLATATAQDSLSILGARRDVGELLFAREEDLAIADTHEIEAEIQDEGAARATRDLDQRRLQAEARRNRILAERSRWRARHRELEILSHMKRKVD
jgi:hypothetical protein